MAAAKARQREKPNEKPNEKPKHGRGSSPGGLLAEAAATADPREAALLLATAHRAAAAAVARADANRAAADPLVRRLMADAAAAVERGDMATAIARREAAHAALGRRRGRVLRVRAQVVPPVVLGLLAAGAALGQLAPHGGYAMAGLCLCVAVAWWWARGRRAAWGDRGRRYRYTVAVTTAASAWSVWACSTGPGGWRAVVLVAGGYAVAAPHWRRVRIPDPPAALPPPPPARVAERGPRTVALWEDRVGCKGGVAPGTRLVDPDLAPVGQVLEAYTVLLPPGRMSLADLQALVKKIASALELGLDEVRVDVHPDRREHLARLLILDRSSAAADMAYPGPAEAFDMATGMAYIGRYPDGETIPWQVFHPEWGGCSGLCLGSTGCGKSRFIEHLCLTLLHTGMVEVWMADPQGGTSLPTLAKYAGWVATDPEEIELMMRGVEVVGTYRAAHNSAFGRSVYSLSPERPMLLVVIDECHEVFLPGHPNTKIGERAASTFRKVGIGMLLASQIGALEVCGGSDRLRSNVLKYNALVMQLASKIQPNLIAGFQHNPTGLYLPGQGFRVPSARDIPGRTWKPLPDADLDAAYAAAARPGLEPGAIGALGDLYAGRHLRRLAARAMAVAELARHDPTIITELNGADPELAAAALAICLAPGGVGAGTATPPGHLWTPPGAQVLGPTGAPARTPAQRTTATGTTLRAARWASVADVAGSEPEEPATAAAADPAGDLSGAARDIYTAVRGGTTRRGEIIAAVNYSETHVDDTLAALVAAGHLVRPRQGQYETTA